MASSAAPVPTTAVYTAADANAAVAYSTFNSLRLGRSAQSVVGRLIRFWDTHNFNKNGDFMGITILLLDEQDSVINGFIPANLTSQLRSSLKAGSIVRLDGFEVDRIPHMYKITEHQFVIRFISSTRIDEVFADGPVIKSDKFMVRRIDHLQVLANTNLKLSDVVGEIRSVKGSDLQNNAATSRIVVRLLIEMVGPTAAQGYTCIDTMEGIRRNDLLSIWELHNLASQIKEHSEVILPNESGDVGLTASSSGPSVLGAKNGEICASAIPHENADALNLTASTLAGERTVLYLSGEGAFVIYPISVFSNPFYASDFACRILNCRLLVDFACRILNCRLLLDFILNCFKMDKLDFPQRLYTLGQEPFLTKSIAYYSVTASSSLLLKKHSRQMNGRSSRTKD
ncbi:hypothetical protein F2Q68_00004944 [Brassica cretica]|uniref:Replication protein A 70 kDa DNA-binding subunit B/D first OB fold domain-containing protein n=1 Tax=Brassica cretica TaxID=69181 RepID=A0A8S9JL27_BRACR|nr:hypothetical protein F2Q68_00004944 [Brassica cretica]